MVKEIPLSQGQIAIIDDDDAELIADKKWYAMWTGRRFYAAHGFRDGKLRGILLMHRVIIAACSDEEVDHINRNSLDNRRMNLRIVTRAQNNQNRDNKRPGRLVGAYFRPSRSHADRPWMASIRVNGRAKHLGVYRTEEDAGRAYDQWALRIYGPGAFTNFPIGCSDAGPSPAGSAAR